MCALFNDPHPRTDPAGYVVGQVRIDRYPGFVLDEVGEKIGSIYPTIRELRWLANKVQVRMRSKFKKYKGIRLVAVVF